MSAGADGWAVLTGGCAEIHTIIRLRMQKILAVVVVGTEVVADVADVVAVDGVFLSTELL